MEEIAFFTQNLFHVIMTMNDINLLFFVMKTQRVFYKVGI